MVTIPFYDMIVVPGVTLYFQSEYFWEIAGEEMEKGERAIFLMLKENKKKSEMKPEDFYPIGVSGVIEGEDKTGNIGIRTISRVNIDSIEVNEDEIYVEATERPEILDMDEEELNRRFQTMRKVLLRSIQGKQWGSMVRTYIMHWKSMNELMAAMAYRFTISNEEKYQILVADSISARTEIMEKIFYEYLEVSKPGQ